MLHKFVLHNDEICSASAPILSAGQAGALMGWGVFSTFRVANGSLFAYDRHWMRMKRDAELLRVPFPANPEWLRERLLRLIAANQCPEATLRICIVRNSGTAFAGPDTGRDFDVVAMTTDLADWGESVRLTVGPNGRFAASPYSRTKVLSWAFNLNSYTEARERGFDEVILLNERREVAECTSANIFAAFGDHAVTPPLTAGCLPGITREILLDAIDAEGISVSERVLTLADLEAADGLFITSSTRDLLPVAEVEGLTVRGNHSICRKLKTLFKSYIEEYSRYTAIT